MVVRDFLRTKGGRFIVTGGVIIIAVIVTIFFPTERIEASEAENIILDFYNKELNDESICNYFYEVDECKKDYNSYISSTDDYDIEITSSYRRSRSTRTGSTKKSYYYIDIGYTITQNSTTLSCSVNFTVKKPWIGGEEKLYYETLYPGTSNCN